MGARRESFRMACHSSFILSVSLSLFSHVSYAVFTITPITARMTDVFVFSPLQFSPFKVIFYLV